MRDRVALQSAGPSTAVCCWHCARPVEGVRVARYLYRGELPHTAIVEDWHRCACGAYQNVRHPTAITVSHVHRP